MSDDRLLIRDIKESVDAILEFVVDGRAAFLKDRRTQFAVIRALQVMGEAAKRVSPAFRAAHPEVPWSAMAKMRDKLIHDYSGVDPRIVWDTAERLPAVREVLLRLLETTQG